jgi:hypothetical protein
LNNGEDFLFLRVILIVPRRLEALIQMLPSVLLAVFAKVVTLVYADLDTLQYIFD